MNKARPAAVVLGIALVVGGGVLAATSGQGAPSTDSPTTDSTTGPDAVAAPASTPSATEAARPAGRELFPPSRADAVSDFDPATYPFEDRVGPETEPDGRRVDDQLVLDGDDGATLPGLRSGPDGEVIVRTAGEVTISDCRLEHRVRVDDKDPAARAVVQGCDIDAPASTGGNAIVLLDSRVTSRGDAVTVVGLDDAPPSLIEGNLLVRDGTRVGDEHHDGIQFWQGGNTMIRRNHIAGWQTSAIMIKSDRSPITDVMIVENYLANESGFFSIYVRDGGNGRPEMVTIRGNVFGPGTPISTTGGDEEQATFVRTEAERSEAIAAGDDEARTWIVWRDNVDAATSEELVPPGGWHTP